MRRFRFPGNLRVFLALTLALAVFAAGRTSTVAQVPGQYSIDWFVVGGGFGDASGGTYGLASSTGQAATFTGSGGPYSLTAGFWAIVDLINTNVGDALKIFVPSGGASTTIN